MEGLFDDPVFGEEDRGNQERVRTRTELLHQLQSVNSRNIRIDDQHVRMVPLRRSQRAGPAGDRGDLESRGYEGVEDGSLDSLVGGHDQDAQT